MGMSRKKNGWLAKIKGNPLLAKIDKRTWWVMSIIVILLIAAGGYGYYKLVYVPAQTAAATPALQTAVVRQGDLMISASGNGTLVAASEASFGFGVSGQVTKVNAKVGDLVKAGDVLAEIDNSAQQVALTQAKRALADMTSPYAIATAEQDVATAMTAVDTARGQLAYLVSPDVLHWEDQIAQAQQDLADAQAAAKSAPSADADAKVQKIKDLLGVYQDKLKGSQDYYQNVYLPQYFTMKDRVSGIKYVAAPTDAEIATARAALDQAKANVVDAQNYLAALKGDPIPADASGTNLTAFENAQLAVKSAEDTLAKTQLIAPISGTVMQLDATIGNDSGTSTVADIADLSQPTIQVYLDPTDWNTAKVGNDAQITFDALPDTTFTGKVNEVDPGLYTSGNTSVVRALVKLDVPQEGFNLPLGSTASVDVIGAQANNVLLIPVEALHPAGDQYTVFVMENGKPVLHVVQIGIQDQVSVEIKSGLQVGDVVTTGIQQVKSQ